MAPPFLFVFYTGICEHLFVFFIIIMHRVQIVNTPSVGHTKFGKCVKKMYLQPQRKSPNKLCNKIDHCACSGYITRFHAGST